jgi:long-chain fatty acid transport protein
MNALTYSLRTTAGIVGAISFLYSTVATAAGAWITENGGPDMAMASAGRAALATDGTTLAANPAGLARLERPGFVVAALPAKLDLEFQGTGSTTGRAPNESPATPMVSAFATARAGRWAAGLGAYSNVGLGCDFGDEWVGRRVIQQAELRTLNLTPAVAYRLSDRLDVGASFGAQLASASASVATGNDAIFFGPPAGLADGRIRMSGDAWAPVASVGLAYRSDDGTALGVAWTSAVDQTMGLSLRTSGLHPVLEGLLQQQGPATLDVQMPQQVTASLTRPVGHGTLLAASVGWQQWSGFGESKLRVAGRGSPLFAQGLADTWNVALGAEHALDSRWTLAGGMAYDSDPSRDGTMPIYFPVAEQLRVAAGLGFRASENLHLRMSASLINQGVIRIDQASHPLPLPGIPSLTGTIRDSRIYVLGFTADYRP